MNRVSLLIRQKFLIIVFIILAIFMAALIFWYLNNLKEKNAGASGNIEIFTARDNIDSGTDIFAAQLESKKIPKNIFNDKFITTIQEIEGKKAILDITKGEIISSDKLEGEGPAERNYLEFSSYIPAGLRAISIPVNYFGELSLINIGDRVDLVLTYFNDENHEVACQTVLTGKEIILIEGKGPDIEEGGQNPSSSSSSDSEEGLLDSSMDLNIPGNNVAKPVVLTFYLSPQEVETVCGALETGVLNLSICPKDNNIFSG